MTRRRFFHESLNPSDGKIVLDRRLSHQLFRVLRFQPGVEVDLCDGKGTIVRVRVVRGEKGDGMAVPIRSWRLSRPDRRISLGLPLAKSHKMDLLVRQAVELGVSRIWCFRASRSQYGLNEHQVRRREQRYRRIMQEALCQSGRGWLPELAFFDSPEALMQVVRDLSKGGTEFLTLLASETESRRGLLDVWESCPQPEEVLCIVGPEGGWSPEELTRFRSWGVQPVHLGPYTLRFETACVVMIGCVQMIWGELGRSFVHQYGGKCHEMH